MPGCLKEQCSSVAGIVFTSKFAKPRPFSVSRAQASRHSVEVLGDHGDGFPIIDGACSPKEDTRRTTISVTSRARSREAVIERIAVLSPVAPVQRVSRKHSLQGPPQLEFIGRVDEQILRFCPRDLKDYRIRAHPSRT